MIQHFARAGFDELCIQQVGGEVERFLELYAEQVLPRVGSGERGHAPPSG